MDEHRTLAHLALSLAARAEQTAIVAVRDDGLDSWSYGRLGREIERVAGGLARVAAPGERVGLWLPNRPEWIVIYFAIVATGAVAVPIENTIADADLARLLEDSGCRRIFVAPQHLPRLRKIASMRPLDVLVVDDDEPAGAESWRRLQADAATPLPGVSEDSIATLLYTSGTTGRAKGVPLTHRNLVANLEALLAEPLASSRDRVLLPLPLHHAYPLAVGMLGTLASGATLVLPAGISGPQIIRALQATDVTVMIGVPRLYEALLAGIEARIASRSGLAAALARRLVPFSLWLRRRWGLSLGRLLFHAMHKEFGRRLRLLGSGGAHLDPKVAWRLEALGWKVLSGYGLSETGPILTFNPPARARIGSEGLAVAGVELRVEPITGARYGEILARGAGVFAGYWNDPPATAAAFAADRWFRTGDLGYVDGDGYLYVVGRSNELIVLPDGKKFFPEALEAVYERSAFIREMAVLRFRGMLCGLVVPDYDAIRSRGTINMEKLLREEIELFSFTLPAHQRLSGYAVVKEPLPRTLLGKLRRHLLPALYESAVVGHSFPAIEMSKEDQALLAAKPAKALWDWLVDRHKGTALTLDTSPQLDLGVDSLEWVNLTLQIEDRFGLRLTEAAVARVVSLRDLLREALAAGERRAPAEPAATAAEASRWLSPRGTAAIVLGLVFYCLNWAVMRGLFRLRVYGRNRLPRRGPYLLAPNHASYLDPFVVAAALPWRHLRHTYWAGWTGRLFTGRFMRLFSRAAQVIPVDPDRSPAASLALAADVLARGQSLVWFPEGRRTPDGRLLPFLSGVGLLLEKSGVAAVPVHIAGTFDAYPWFRSFPRLKALSVTFGAPRSPASLAAAGRGDTAPARAATALHDAVAALAGGS